MGWGNDMGDDNIDIVILHIDMGYLVALAGARQTLRVTSWDAVQLNTPGFDMRVDDVASHTYHGTGRFCSPRRRMLCNSRHEGSILLATSWDALQLKTRRFKCACR